MLIAPPYIKKGDLVAITAPASKLELESLEISLDVLQNDWGLKAWVGTTVGKSYNGFSDTDINRKNELQDFLDDPSIKLILSARGGYGCSKIIDSLNFDKFKNNPKWVCGFSDLTALLLEINSLGFQAIHGVMAKTMNFDPNSNLSLKKLLFGEKINYKFKASPSNILGNGKGEAVGGNLALLVHSIGSPSDISYDGKILFLEDISEYYYNLDRMMLQLRRAGKLNKLEGLVVGDFSDCKENDIPFGKNYKEIISEHVSEFNYPIAFDFSFGHEKINLAVRMGETIKLDVNKKFVSLKSI